MTKRKIWEGRVGRPKIYTPKTLWEEALAYFEFQDNEKWIRKEVIKGGDMAGSVIEVKLTTPYSLVGLYLFLDIEESTFRKYRESYGKEFKRICSRILSVIYKQKINGATVGEFNHNTTGIVAYLSGQGPACGKSSQDKSATSGTIAAKLNKSIYSSKYIVNFN